MPSQIIDPRRITKLNQSPTHPDAQYVLYWMQASQRTQQNHALEYAVQRANELELPLLVVFVLTADVPETNWRFKQFMLEGIRDVSRSLKKRNIGFVLRVGDMADQVLDLSQQAALVVTDRGYLRFQKKWRRAVAGPLDVAMMQVESDVVVPVETASDKREFAARTIRPKIHRQMESLLVELKTTAIQTPMDELPVNGEDPEDIEGLLGQLTLDRSVKPVPMFVGGQSQAATRLSRFLEVNFDHYAAHRNQPQTDDATGMSMYLHFGQISPIDIALKAREKARDQESLDSLIEELIVRRELAINCVSYSEDYNRYETLPDFARKTLDEHRDDVRQYVYTREELDGAQTHDPYWNAAMREMKYTGYMHNYMRMYWGKKILEWSASPEEAFETALYLNNRYFLDGRDANSFTGVAWCFGLHDRPWMEREVFGKIRYMNANGLKRKCDPEAYIAKVDRLVEQCA